jgi:deazaflavin-dependent oxidoreductase (nitroreductase family)
MGTERERPSSLARAARYLTRFRRIQPQVGRVHAAVLRRTSHVQRRSILAGRRPVLALTTTGRRSGRPRSTVLRYVRAGDGYVVGAVNLGSERDPAWAINLRADPHALVTVNGERVPVLATEPTGDEARRLWQALIDDLPASADSVRLARRHRDVPLFVLAPGPAGSRDGH